MEDPDDDGGYSAAFDRCAPLILRFARRRADSADAAWDVVSDTFTAAWRHWDRRPPDDAALLPWLYAIAGNAVRDQRRSAQRRGRLAERLARVPVPRAAPDPADGVVAGQALGDALARLSASDREVLTLVAWEGQTDARALGLVLGVRPASARSRVARARRRLRALLDEDPSLRADGPPRTDSAPAAGRTGRLRAEAAAVSRRPAKEA